MARAALSNNGHIDQRLCVVCIAFTGCSGFGFVPFYPRLENGTETETRVTMQVSLTAPGLVTCAAFVQRPLAFPLPTTELVFEPVVDPYIAPEARQSIYDIDPVGRFFLSRSTPVNITSAGTIVSVDVFVSMLGTALARNIQVNCAAKCTNSTSISVVSLPVAAMLRSCACGLL